MKLRIENSSIRFRLTQTEVSHFAESGSISAVTPLGGRTLIYSLQSSDTAGAVRATFDDARIAVIVPDAMADNWASTDDVGIRAEQDTGGDVLQILIEKDFQCFHREKARRNADAYPHPLEENAPDRARP